MTPTLYKSGKRSRDELFAAIPGLAVTESLFESVRDSMFCIKDRDRRYVSVNEAFIARARKGDRSAVLGRTAAQVFPPLLAAAYEQQDDVVFSTGQQIVDKLEMVTNPDGSTGWYLSQKQPIRDRTGTVVALAGVSTDLHSPAGDDPRLAAIAGAVEKIQTGFDRPLRMATLATEAGMSLSQFERRLRAVLRVSPRQLLTLTRVAAAARALRRTDDPLNRIAIAYGFYDQALFSRQFRSVTGLTPRQYRTAANEPE